MQKNINTSWLAFAPEATPLEVPVSWTGAGTYWIEHLAVDVANIREARIQDMTLVRRATAVKGAHMTISGSRNCQFTATFKLHGSAATTPIGSQIAQMYLGRIYEHYMGGQHRSTSHAIVGGTAAIPILDSVAGLVPGAYLSFEDKTDAPRTEIGRLHPRCILSIDAVTKAVTLDVALPFTPAAEGDVAHGVIASHPAEDILTDAFTTNTTWSWFVKRSRTGGDLLWAVEGCVISALKIDGLSKGGLPSLAATIEGCNFDHSIDDGLTSPQPTEFHGAAQISGGKDFVVLIGEYGDNTLERYDAATLSVDLPIARQRINGQASTIPRAEGTIGYGFTMNDALMTITIAPYHRKWYTGMMTGKTYWVYAYEPGDGSGPGKGHGVHFRKAQLMEQPTRTDADTVHAITLKFAALEPDNADVGSNEDLEKALVSTLLY